MAILIIQTNPDGTAMVAAPAQVPPELLQDAVPAANLEEAMELAEAALGQGESAEGGEGDDTMAGAGMAGEDGGEAAPGMPGAKADSTATGPAQSAPQRDDEMDMDDEERQMQGGYRNAAKGR